MMTHQQPLVDKRKEEEDGQNIAVHYASLDHTGEVHVYTHIRILIYFIYVLQIESILFFAVKLSRSSLCLPVRGGGVTWRRRRCVSIHFEWGKVQRCHVQKVLIPSTSVRRLEEDRNHLIRTHIDEREMSCDESLKQILLYAPRLAQVSNTDNPRQKEEKLGKENQFNFQTADDLNTLDKFVKAFRQVSSSSSSSSSSKTNVSNHKCLCRLMASKVAKALKQGEIK